MNIKVFISHAWAYSEHYEKLAGWVFDKKWTVGNRSLNIINKSIPKDDPIHNANNDEQLQQAIYERILDSDVIVIPTGMYASYSKWIQKEIDGSKKYDKPILAVELRASQRTSSVVANAANETVGWTSKSVVNGIWKLFNL